MTSKSKWRAILLGCFACNSHSVPLDSKRLISDRHSSPQRLSLSDLSDPGCPLSVNELPSSLKGSNLHIFTLAEIEVIINDFSSSQFLGEGGFGPVYKGFIDGKIRPDLEAQAVAVKLLDMESTQGHREWLTEVVFLGQLKHPNLVKLVGYCCQDENRVLVYEYMAKGNLENQLFRRFSISLPWLTRIKIAVGAARGLAFLHGVEKPVIFRDFKTSNILLDCVISPSSLSSSQEKIFHVHILILNGEKVIKKHFVVYNQDYTAKLSDFGLAKDGPEGDHTHVTTRVMGTHGYAAPEYVMTGHLTTMSDVYSFGVVLLELLTGRGAMDKSRPSREQNLVEWARPLLKDFHKLDRLMDPNLDGQYCMEGARKVATLAYHCLSNHAKSRPTMDNVVKTLENILELKNSQVGSFVYVVPTDEKKTDDAASRPNKHQKNEAEKENNTDTNGCEEGSEDDQGKELKGYGCRRGRNGLRHRHRLRARAVYSDTSLYLYNSKKLIGIAKVQ